MRIRFHRAARNAPETIDGLKVPYAAAKRNAPKWRWRLILLAVLSPALYLVFTTLQGMMLLSANGSVLLRQHEVRAPATARVAELPVRAGAQIEKGDVLVRLKDASLDTTIADLEARLGVLRTPAGPPSEQLQAYIALQSRAVRAREEKLATMHLLVREGAATAAELAEAQASADQAAAALLQLQDRAVKPSGDQAAIEQQRLQAELQQLLARREQLVLRAPDDGRVLDVFVAENEFAGAGAPLLLLGSASEPQVVAYVSPDISSHLDVGARATIAFPDGSHAQALVSERPMLTRRMPADLVDQFGLRPMTVVLHLQTDEAWPAAQRVHGLPVDVRFHFGWERRIR